MFSLRFGNRGMQRILRAGTQIYSSLKTTWKKRYESHKELANSTSEFRYVDLVSLNIKYDNIESSEHFAPCTSSVAPDYIYITERVVNALTYSIFNTRVIRDLNKKEKTNIFTSYDVI